MIQTLTNDQIPENIKANSLLRDAYIKYQELASRGKLRLRINKQINFDLGSQLYFFRSKDSLFFQHPDKQQEFYEKLLHDITQEIKPQRVQSYPKQLQQQIKNLNQQKYTPETLKQRVIQLYKRKICQLKMRKLRTVQNYEDINNQQPLIDQVIKHRIILIDNQINTLNERLARLKVDDGIKNHNETKQSLHSNLFLDDAEIYIRDKIWKRKLKQPLIQMGQMLKWMHFQHRYEIQENAHKILNEMRIENINKNKKYYNDIVLNIEGKLNLKYQMNRELTLQLSEYLKPLKFHPIEDSPHKQRFDRIPLIIFTDYEMQNQLYGMASKLLKNPKSFGEQKLIFHLSNLQHMMDGYQRYLYAWDKTEKNEYEGYSGLQKLTIELSAFDDSEELLKALINPLPIYLNVSLQFMKSDWKQLLNIKNLQLDEFQTYTQNKLNFVTIDAHVEKIVRLLPIQFCKQMQTFIQQEISTIRSDNYILFNIIENHDYVEYTRESLRLSQVNELYQQTEQKDIFYRHKSKFKNDFVKAFEEVMIELIPKESHLQAYFNTVLSKMREYDRKILYIINAFQSIERKLTFSLLSIRDCKVHNNVDSKFLIKQGSKNELPPQNSRRDAMVSFIDAIEHMEDKYFRSLKPDIKYCKIEDEITYGNEELPDVFVKQKLLNPIYESSLEQHKATMTRLVQQISLYINKYEKISSVKKINLIINRFQCVLDCLEEEAKYQFKKLQLVQTYLELFDQTMDQYHSYQIVDKIFEIMYSIPIMDFESMYFLDSYQLNVKSLSSERELVQMLLKKQKSEELNLITQIQHQYMQLRCSEIQQVQSRPITPEEKQKAPAKLDEQYDYQSVSNKMSQIFQELNQANKQSQANMSQVTKDIKIVDPNALLLPFQIYEECQSVNYLESVYKVLDVVKIVYGSLNQLRQSFPQISNSGYLSLQIAHLQQALTCGEVPIVKRVNDNSIFDCEYGLLQKYLERIKQMDTLSVIQHVSLFDFERTLNQQALVVSDICAIANMCEYLQLRKQFFNTNIEMKIQHRMHKKIHGYDKMSKTADLYFKSSFSDTSSQYKKQQSMRLFFSPYCFEVDASPELSFLQLKNLESLIFHDVIEEFRNIVLYDKVNSMFLQTQNELRFLYLDDYFRTQMDIKYLQIGYLPENSKLTQKLINIHDYNEKQLLESMPQKPQDLDDLLLLPKIVKSELLTRYIKKFSERQKLTQFQSEKSQLIYQKKETNLKLYMIRQLIHDFLHVTMQEAVKVDLLYTHQRVQRIAQIIPNYSPQSLSIKLLTERAQGIQVLETNIHIDQFYSRDDFIMKKLSGPNKLLSKYFKHYEQYLIEIIRFSTIHLNWFELMHLNELYLFNLVFDNYDYAKEMLYQQGKNPLKSLLSYDNKMMDVQNCTSDHYIEQRALVAQAIDKMIDKIKCFFQIGRVFVPFLDGIEEMKIKNNNQEQLIPQLKQRYQQLYIKTHSIYHSSLLQISKDFPSSNYSHHFRLINQHLFLQHQFNRVNLNFFDTQFIVYSDKYAIKSSLKYRLFKKNKSNKYSNQIQMIKQLMPIQRDKLITNYSNSNCNISLMIQIPGIIDVDERIMLRKQQSPHQLLSEAYIMLQNPKHYKSSCVEIKYFLNLLEAELRDKKITLKEVVYRSFTETSIRAMQENVNLLQQHLSITPEYVERNELTDKLVSKVNIAIPRVKYINSLSSTLITKNTEIHNSLKLAFIQGFLNRLKNKSIQTNLLTSGIGYSISSQDIEDCLNILNRDLYTFAENELNTRMDTFNIIYESQRNHINQLKRQLSDVTLEHKQLQNSFEDRLQALVIAKSNKVLFELDMLKQKHADFVKYELQQCRCTQGLEETIREQIESKYKVHVEQLTFERDKVIEKFMDLKQELITLFTQEVKNNQEALIKYVQAKTNEMLSEVPLYRRVNTILVEDEPHRNHPKPDILFEPYKFTKALHQLKEKMQRENEDLRVNYEKQLNHYKSQCTSFEELKIQLGESRKKENTMKMEIITLQQTINQLLKQKEELTEQNESLRFEKKRILKSNEDYQQKIKQYKQKTQDGRRRNAISVDNYSMTQSIEKKVLPQLFRSEQKPMAKLKL